MRTVRYPSRGKPASLTAELEELVMLTQAAISIANTQRRVLDRDAPSLHTALDRPRGSAYEVTVVDHFYQLSQRAFERRGQAAVWERPFRTGVAGSPEAADIALFDAKSELETRLEFGLYTLTKLRKDANKLARLSGVYEKKYENVRNYLLLWVERSTRMTQQQVKKHLDRMARDAAKVSPASVELLMVSGVDLFAESHRQHRVAYVGAFQVR